MDAVIFELLVKTVPTYWVVSFHQNREIRIVGNFLVRLFQTANAFHALESFALSSINFFALGERLAEIFQLQ